MLHLLAALIVLAPVQDKEVKLLKKTKLLTSYRLPNGLEVILVENHTIPLVTVEIAVRTGAFTETPKTDGLAHLYEHMFFKGNAAYPTQEEYDRREAELGISSNGTTSTEAVKYFITLPATYLEEGMEFIHHALLTMKIDPTELEKEKTVVLNEYDRNESDPGFYLRQSVGRRLFYDYFYRKNPIGDRAAILSSTAELLQDFRARYYVPNNSALILQGDFDPEAALRFARHFFGEQKWPAGPDPHATPLPAHPKLAGNQTVVVTREFPQAMIQIGQYGPNVGADATQTRETYVADVLGTIVSLPGSKFQRTLVDSGLCAGASWSYYTQHDGGEMDLSAVCEPAKLAEVYRALLDEVEKFDDPGYFTAADLKGAQRQLEVGHIYEQERGQDFAVNLAFWWAVAGLDYTLDYIPQVKKVRLDDLRAFARKWIIGKVRVTGVLVGEENREHAMALLPEGGEHDVAGPALSEFALGNGLRVIHRPSANDVVALQLFINGGAQNVTADTQGVEALVLAAMQRGSERFTKDDVQSRLAELGAQVGEEAGYDYSTLSLKCLKGDFAAALEIFADAVTRPTFPEDDVAQIREQTVQMLSAQDADAQQKMIQTCNEVFYAGHPYARQPNGTVESVAKLTREQVVAHYKEIFTAGRLLLVVVGDADPKLLEKAFGSLPKGDYARPPAAPFGGGDGVKIKRVNREIPTSWVLGKFPVPTLTHEEYAPLRVGLEVLSNRLKESVRTKAGISYAVFSGIGEFESNYGYLYVTSPKPNEAIKLMYQEVQRIRTEPVDAADLQAVALTLYTRHFMRTEPNDGQAGAIGRGVLTGNGPQTYDRLMERVREVTPAQAQAALDKYLRGYQYGIVGPEDWIDEAAFTTP